MVVYRAFLKRQTVFVTFLVMFNECCTSPVSVKCKSSMQLLLYTVLLFHWFCRRILLLIVTRLVSCKDKMWPPSGIANALTEVHEI